MKVSKPYAETNGPGWGAILALVLLLGFLFWRSFLPDYVHFSNDGPLGQQNTASAQLPDAFQGTWIANNDIGFGLGSWPFSFSALFRWAVGPVGYAKFLVPFALFILGLGAWSFLRQLKLSRLAATLGALAAVLNSTFFATACWGVAPQEIAVGMDYFALALVVSITLETPLVIRLGRLALAGFCLGMNVIEAADIGAIFSLFASAFILMYALTQESGPAVTRIAKGVGQIFLIAVFAGFIACQAVVSLVGTQIQGIVGTSQDSQSKAEHWDWATQWSLPKAETLGLFVPGLFGYKMDTPMNMDPGYREFYEGGNYWGGMGRDPRFDRYFASGSQGDPPQGMIRQTSGTNYSGILVILIAIWAAAQSLRKEDSVFSDLQKRQVRFWSVVVLFTVLFAWGRFSFFYALLYHLPYFSTIRSPTKFLIVFSWAVVVLFAYGVDGFSRRYLTADSQAASGPNEKKKSWWALAPAFDRKWTVGCGAAVVASLVAWLIYSSEKNALSHYLQTVQFPNDPSNPLADIIAAFSIRQAGWFVVLLAVAVTLTILIISGVLGGRRGKVGGFLLGLFLVFDMGRANLPYITYWDYIQKYDIDTKVPGQSSNPILNLLRDKPYEQRVSELPFRAPPGTPGFDWFQQLYTIEWMQHQFPYYNIQSLDNWQRPRVPEDVAAYDRAVYFPGTQEGLPLLTREWELTNTRYLFGAAGMLDLLNSAVDPEKHRFRIVERFNVGPKPGITQPSKLEEITALPDSNGSLALFEFTGALPRAKLYSTWQVNTNDAVVLRTLTEPSFDPAQKVLVSTPEPGLTATATNENGGSVEFKSYRPRKIYLTATTPRPAVLLINEKYDDNWHVTVDGQAAPVLRCNFIMRGVFLNPGSHTIEFAYTLPNKPLYVTLAAFILAILLGGFLLVNGTLRTRHPAAAPTK